MVLPLLLIGDKRDDLLYQSFIRREQSGREVHDRGARRLEWTEKDRARRATLRRDADDLRAHSFEVLTPFVMLRVEPFNVGAPIWISHRRPSFALGGVAPIASGHQVLDVITTTEDFRTYVVPWVTGFQSIAAVGAAIFEVSSNGGPIRARHVRHGTIITCSGQCCSQLRRVEARRRVRRGRGWGGAW